MRISSEELLFPFTQKSFFKEKTKEMIIAFPSPLEKGVKESAGRGQISLKG